MTRDQKIAKARKLRNNGLPLKDIASALDVAVTTVIRWTDPEANERQLAQSRKWKARHKYRVTERNRHERRQRGSWKGGVRTLDGPDVFPAGRRCSDCTTVLTIWNPGPKCFRHTAPELEDNDTHIDLLLELEAA